MDRLLAAIATALMVAGTLLLTGCGQTGALYFDEDPPADQLPPSRRSTPVSVVPIPVDKTVPASTPAGDQPAGKPAPKN